MYIIIGETTPKSRNEEQDPSVVTGCTKDPNPNKGPVPNVESFKLAPHPAAAASGAGTGAFKETEERAVDTALPGDMGANSPRSQQMRVEQVKNATELKEDRKEYNQSKEVFRHLTDSDLKSANQNEVMIANKSIKSMQDGVDTFNAKVSMYTNTEGDYARIAVEVGYKFCFSGPLSSADQAEKVLRRFTPKVAEYWKYFEKGRKLRKELESNGKEVDVKALEDAASE